MTKLGSWIKERGLSQAAFAEMVGTGQSSIAKFVLGMRVPRPPLMRRIEEATEGEITAKDLYDDYQRQVDMGPPDEAA